MAFFLCRLLPPRPTFQADMTEGERAVMQRHVDYWREIAGTGQAVVFGPVADPAGAWGMAVLDVESRTAADVLLAKDPALTAEIGMTVDLLAMPVGVTRPA